MFGNVEGARQMYDRSFSREWFDHNENDDSKNFSMLCKDLLNWSSFSILVLISNLSNPWFCASSKKKTFLSFKVPRWNDLNWGVPETTNVSRKFAIYDKY